MYIQITCRLLQSCLRYETMSISQLNNNSKASYVVECSIKKHRRVSKYYSLPVVYMDHCNSNFHSIYIFYGFRDSIYVDYTVTCFKKIFLERSQPCPLYISACRVLQPCRNLVTSTNNLYAYIKINYVYCLLLQLSNHSTDHVFLNGNRALIATCVHRVNETSSFSILSGLH